MGVKPRRRRHERQQNQDETGGGPKLHAIDRGKSDTFLFFEKSAAPRRAALQKGRRNARTRHRGMNRCLKSPLAAAAERPFGMLSDFQLGPAKCLVSSTIWPT